MHYCQNYSRWSCIRDHRHHSPVHNYYSRFRTKVSRNHNPHYQGFICRSFKLHHTLRRLAKICSNRCCIESLNLLDLSRMKNLGNFNHSIHLPPISLGIQMLINLTHNRYTAQKSRQECPLVQYFRELYRNCNLKSYIPNHKNCLLAKCWITPYFKIYPLNDKFCLLFDFL